MDLKASRTIEVAALGRPFSLGMLYDCRQDSLVPGMTLWDRSDLQNEKSERPQPHSDFEIVASESIEGKSSALNVDGSLKASFLGGMVEVGGSAKYLNDQKTSRNQARVTLTYKTTTKFQELSMDQLGEKNIKHQYVFKKGIATHVVTGILYGAQAFFIFDRELSSQENHQDIQGSMKVVIKNIPSYPIKGDGSLKMENKDKSNVDKFSCKFYGDFSLQRNPVSFQDAVKVYQSLPTLLGANGENAVPLKVWLLPLTVLDSRAAKLVREISSSLVQEAQNVLEDFSDLEMRYNDLLQTTTAQQFSQITRKLKCFKKMTADYKLKFQKSLAEKLPSIRGGGEEEAELAEILKKRHSSPFNSKDLHEWLDCKEREIYMIQSFTNMMKNTKIISSENHLFRESVDVEHTVCFVFTSLESADPYLSALSHYLKGEDPQDLPTPNQEWHQRYTAKKRADEFGKRVKFFNGSAKASAFVFTSLGSAEPYLSALFNYLRGTTNPNVSQDPYNYDPEREQWCASKKIADEMRKKAQLFNDFAEANKDNENTKFLVMGLTDETQRGSAIYLYQHGFSVSEIFEPPSKPEAVTVSDIQHSSVTLKISPPRFGLENITSYLAEFCVCGEEEWQKQTVPIADEIIVRDLKPNTEYMFRCRVVTSAGVGPANEVSASDITLPPKSLGEVLKHVSNIITSGYPSVYEVPLEEEYMNIDGCRRYWFGKPNMKRNRTIMLLGATGSGKSTLINGMINYILGLEWGDDFRFKLVNDIPTKSQAHSQTCEVTVYKLYHQEGFKIPFSLTIVDTPGFGDTRGIERDIKITEQIRALFSAKHGVRDIDAVCVVAQAALARLTPTQRYVFDSVLSIFGKDIAENIRLLVTFADGQQPPVLEAISASGVPCPKTDEGVPVHFMFNNSALFANNTGSNRDGGFVQMFWNMGTKSMERFFNALDVVDTKSLTMTKEVLRERKQLEETVEELQKQVQIKMAKLSEIQETAEILKTSQADINRNKDFEFEVTIKKPFQISVSGDEHFVTNCQVCNYTCHDKCAYADDKDKIRCSAMGKDGHCTVCDKKCFWNVHFNQKYMWEYKRVTEKRTVDELKKRYLKATEKKISVQALIERMQAEYEAVEKDMLELVKRSTSSLNRLKEIALKPNPLSTPEYIDMLAEGEKRDAQPGWKERVKSLLDIRKKAECIFKIGKGEKV